MTTLISVATVAVSVAVSEEPKVLAAADAGTGELALRGDLSSSLSRQSYHELGLPTGAVNGYRNGTHVVEMDVLEQLKSNMFQLEEMHARLKFMMAEVRYLVIRE